MFVLNKMFKMRLFLPFSTNGVDNSWHAIRSRVRVRTFYNGSACGR